MNIYLYLSLSLYIYIYIYNTYIINIILFKIPESAHLKQRSTQTVAYDSEQWYIYIYICIYIHINIHVYLSLSLYIYIYIYVYIYLRSCAVWCCRRRWCVTISVLDVSHETLDVIPCRTSLPLPFFRTCLARSAWCNTMSHLTAAGGVSSLLHCTGIRRRMTHRVRPVHLLRVSISAGLTQANS